MNVSCLVVYKTEFLKINYYFYFFAVLKLQKLEFSLKNFLKKDFFACMTQYEKEKFLNID